MWGKIMIPMYRLWLHGLYELYGPRCPLSPERPLTHWGRVTHICVGIVTSSGSDNGLSLWRRQAIIWTNAGILLIEPLETNFSEILIRIQAFSFKKMHLTMSSAKRRPFCLGLNVLNLITHSLCVRLSCLFASYCFSCLSSNIPNKTLDSRWISHWGRVTHIFVIKLIHHCFR